METPKRPQRETKLRKNKLQSVNLEEIQYLCGEG